MKTKVTLPDGSVREMERGATAMDVARSISEGLARNVLAAKVDGAVRDANEPLPSECTLQLLTWSDQEGKATLWHSSAHVMAEALEALYPGTRFGIGPPTENGFYYDIDLGERSLGEDDFAAIEAKFKELAAQKLVFSRKPISKADAVAYFRAKGDPYKLEILEGLEDGQITFYTQGNFTDLCRGPHLPDTSHLRAFKVLGVAGAYWRGDEKRKQLTRVSAIAFPKQKELEEHLALIEEAKKRDHRKLGKELDLFTFSARVGAGLPLWLPKGAALRERLIHFMKTAQEKAGYLPVATPHIGTKALYVTSGHWEKYGKDSFRPIGTPQEGEEFMLKPMNCPHHCEIFASRPRSYKDLPLRLAEFGTVYRYEQSGELHGLARVRGFTQDDAHLFCRPDQVKEEFLKVIDLVLLVLRALNFEHFEAQVSLRDKKDRSKYIGTEENWTKAEAAIQEAAAECGMRTTVEYGEAAFYGPKLDFMVRDALGRKWQLGTIQIDYNLPERFQLEYIGSDNAAHRPVMIHRAPFGSLERFIGLIIEHTAGNFPLWLAPEQAVVLPISDKYLVESQNLLAWLKDHDIRAAVDERNEKIGRKIRDAEIRKVPFMLVIGEKEAATNMIAVRAHGQGDLGTMSTTQFKALVDERITLQLSGASTQRTN
jgi:threonyl-tRNA synthetase